MLTFVHIHRYRSCQNVILERIGSLLVLIGRNAAGKSNILKAIEGAAKIASGNAQKPTAFIESNEIAITFEFLLKDVEYRYILENKAPGYPDKDSVFKEVLLTKTKSGWIELINRNNESVVLGSQFGPIETSSLSISAHTSSFVALQSILPEGSEFRIISEQVVKFFSSVKYYPLNFGETDQPHPINTVVLQDKEYKKWVADGFPDKGDISLMYKILHLKMTEDPRFDELQELLGENNLRLLDHIDISSLAFDQSEKKDVEVKLPPVHVVWFHPLGQPGRYFSYSDLSFGTKRVVSLLVAMLFDSSSVSLIEQPEDGIHSGLVNRLAELLEAYSYNAQFLIASHSITLLNRLSPQAVRIVEMIDGTTQTRALSQSEVAAANRYLERDGTFFEFLRTIQED